MLESSNNVILRVGLLLFGSSLRVGEQPKPQTPRGRYEALLKDYEVANAAWEKSGARIAPTDPLWVEHYADRPLWNFAPRLLQFAEENRSDPAALDALLNVVENSGTARDRILFSSVRRAVGILIADHLQDERVVKTFLTLSFLGGPSMEAYLRALLAKSRDREVLGRACMALVRCNDVRVWVAERPYFEHPEDHPDRLAASKFLNARLDPGYISYIRTTDPVTLSAEREVLLERADTNSATSHFCRSGPRLSPTVGRLPTTRSRSSRRCGAWPSERSPRKSRVRTSTASR